MIKSTDWVSGSDVHMLDDIIAKEGWTPLNPDLSYAYVVKEDGEIIGFTILQMIAHCGPQYVNPINRGNGITEDMARAVIEKARDVGLKGFMVIADSPYTSKLCDEFGLEKINNPTYFYRG